MPPSILNLHPSSLLKTFFEKFELFADAPDVVAKMRELIIDLAVKGKLVENSSNELPANSAKLQKSRKYPANWREANLGNVLTFEYGKNLPAKKRSETGEYPVYGSNGIVGTHCAYTSKDPAIIVGRKGSAGALNIAEGPSFTTDVAYSVVPPDFIELGYAYFLLKSLRLNELGKGIKPGLSRKEAYALKISLPPLAEQKRIVAKVDALMALCDQLEAQQQARDTRQAALARASLARFADAPTPENLNFLFHPSYPIQPADLRKSILTLAVQGKLVPQDPGDEPADKLIAQLEIQLTPDQKKKQTKPLPPLTPDEHLYKLPTTWTWRRFRDIATIASNLVKPEKFSDYKHLAPDNIEKRNGVILPCRTVEEDKVRSSNHRFYSGQIVYSKIRPNLSKVVIVDFDGLCSADMYPIDALIDPLYLHKYMLSAPFLIQAVKTDTRVAMPKINQTELNAIAVPVPPLDEQRRIVAKVDQLMALVDKLETQLAESRSAAQKLLEALVAELTAA
jgi:type I restriction enzyme S subunit